ncbi:hypothetical protein Suden_0109 [Sulfurimonas denitrificans DSM 1251]|uniref:Uncharacterized protein n=1 Tax=Sulfurimonas denitrificans (strain ATCC 33889 / DSM 1251) TaxID=326298 RepID=Q30UE1_SULDN|nr:hypothetical protein [Sulfurimonas denitrificans]ABB43390.1 hypothetical protein Suden_0109 [Sulfurimonas denitrificans DSM 1251]MDD3442260.1 hypothetical protein [Sulfurimonas denitrificans]
MSSDKSQITQSVNFLSYIKSRIDELKKLVGIVDQKEPISFKISEFMQEVNSSLMKLPKEYKNLYELKVAEGDFFINREAEIQKLHLSYENWFKDRFVTCAIIGEKGCGVTSALNSFLKKIPQIETIKADLSQKIYTDEEYFAFFNSLLKTEDIKNNKGLIDFLNNTQEHKIIIIENLHHMFLKKVGGFESMEMLFELLSYTTKKVLWIGVFTPQTWNYLDKTIAISNYFTSEIVMEQLGYETIKEIILKRIDCESTRLEFIPNEQTIESKTFQNLSQSEKQSYLQEKFFKLLHKLSNGNISLAQLYWIRSISATNDNGLGVEEIDDFDYSFIKNLSSEALFTLQALILHDGLSIKDFSTVMHESLSQSRKILMPMLERGLLIQPNKKYNINPAIYKPVYDYLSSKNFIH